MRLRLGLLRDSPQPGHAARDPVEVVQAKKQKLETAEKAKEAASEVKSSSKPKDGVADAARLDETTEKAREKPKVAPKPRIRPLTEAKAIDTGATFISEAFLFLVGGGLIVLESWRSRRKENTRREDIADRLAELEESEKVAIQALVALEKEVLRLKGESQPDSAAKLKRILPKEVWDPEGNGDMGSDKPVGWWSWFRSLGRASNKAVASEKSPPQQPDEEKTPPKPPAETPERDEPLAARIAHSVASMREDATPPPTSPTGETEAIIDSTS
jgi:optic atrophy 3 protein